MPEYSQIAHSAKWDHGAQQKEEELAALLRFMYQRNVSSVLEIGCDAGGTLFAWSKLGIKNVFAIDLWNGGFSSGMPRHNHGAAVFDGNSHDPATRRAISEAIFKYTSAATVDMLFIDGDHTYSGVSNDFWMYKRLVRSGGYIAIHDICEMTKGTNDIQVHRFWKYLKTEYPNWQSWEFKQFPENWGGIGIIRNYEMPRTNEKIELCTSSHMLKHPMSGEDREYDQVLSCDYPKHHNLGVASQHHSQGVYWW